MNHKYLLKYCTIGAMAMSLAGCSDAGTDSTVVEEPEKPIEEPDTPEVPPEEDPDDDPDIPFDDPVDPDDPEAKWEGILIAAMATDVEIANTGFARLSVKMVSTEGETLGEGVVGKKIAWGIESGDMSVSLKSKSSITKDGGIAQQTVNALGIAGDAVVIASSPVAPKPVRFNITVDEKPVGNLKILTKYEGKAPVSYYSIRLYDGIDVQCYACDLKNGNIPSFLNDGQAEPILDPVDSNTALFEKLEPDMRYSVIAYGYSEAGAPVAAGCLDSGLEVHADQTTTGTVYLNTIDLDPVTTYHVRSYFDLGDVTSALGTVGSVITRVLDFASNPGRSLYDLIMNLMTGYFGGVAKAIEVVLNLLTVDDLLVNAINDFASSNSVVCKAGLFACQLRDMVRLMEFLGEFNIEKVGQIELAGKDTYQGFAVYWRMNCDGTDPNCGRYPLTTDLLRQIDGNHIDKSIDFLSGTWNGSLANGYDKLSVEAHELKLYYGQILVYVLEKILLPKITGDKVDRFDDLLSYWINCEKIGKWIYDTIQKANKGWTDYIIPDSIVPSQTTTTSWCNGAVSGLSTLLGFAKA